MFDNVNRKLNVNKDNNFNFNFIFVKLKINQRKNQRGQKCLKKIHFFGAIFSRKEGSRSVSKINGQNKPIYSYGK